MTRRQSTEEKVKRIIREWSAVAAETFPGLTSLSCIDRNPGSSRTATDLAISYTSREAAETFKTAATSGVPQHNTRQGEFIEALRKEGVYILPFVDGHLVMDHFRL